MVCKLLSIKSNSTRLGGPAIGLVVKFLDRTLPGVVGPRVRSGGLGMVEFLVVWGLKVVGIKGWIGLGVVECLGCGSVKCWGSWSRDVDCLKAKHLTSLAPISNSCNYLTRS